MPVFESHLQLGAALPVRAKDNLRELPVVVHPLTHKDLHLHPVRLGVGGDLYSVGDNGAWFGPGQWPGMGLPAPIRRLLEASAG
jgi:A/G-specific adenine glycosylase